MREIKDRLPNQDTIQMLEDMLENARAGRLRTVVTVAGWDDDSWSHSWCLDYRSGRRRMIGELSMLQFDLLTNQAFHDGDTVLSRAFE